MDSHEWRVYQAEQSIDAGLALPDVRAARAVVARVRRSAWWRDTFEDSPRISVVVDGREDHQGPYSWAQGDRRYLPSSHTLHLHPMMLNEIVLLHELAHCLAPRFAGDPRRIAAGRVDWSALHAHGSGFTGMLSELVRRVGTGTNHEHLAAAYRHFEVPVDSFDGVLRDRATSLEVESTIAAEVEKARAFDEGRPNKGRIPPPPPWGWWLLTSRRYQRDRPTMGRARLAEALTPIEACNARDIKRLEEAASLPDSMRLRRIALAAAALLGIDPVWARTERGLARWDCGIELDELRVIAPEWVAEVEHLNGLSATRPALWKAEGDR